MSAALAAGLVCALPAGRVAASGLETSGIGARGRSMGYSLAAVADDWSTLYYNPAGLALLESSQSACIYEFFTGGTFSSDSLRNLTPADGPDPARGDFIDFVGDEPPSFTEKKVEGVVHAGEFGWTGRRGGWGYGIGLFGSGAGSTWDDSVPVYDGGSLSGEVSFSNISINVPLGLARNLGPGLAAGAVLNLRFGRLDALYEKSRRGPVPYRLSSEQNTDGYGAGLDLGLLWTASPLLSIGVVWRLPAVIVRKGSTSVENTLAGIDVSSNTRVVERIPARATLGTALRLRPGSILALSVTWLNWGAYNRDTEYENQVPGVLENTSGNPSHWEDALVVNLGGEFALTGPWLLRAGLVWDQAPEPREYRTLTGGQTMDVWKLTIGLGRESESSTIDGGYTYTWGPETAGYLPGASYRLALHEFYLGYTWHR